MSRDSAASRVHKLADGELAQRKATFRATMKRRLAEHAATGDRNLSDRISERALNAPELARARGILLCLSFGHEVDTWGLVDRLLEADRRVYVPRTNAREHRLHVHPYPCPLRTLSFGLKQPPKGTPEVSEEQLRELVDVVLILGLAFDRKGIRLGHGAGYFDRFLAERRRAGHSLPALGLAYHFQLVEELPAEPHDVPMTAVVTEQGAWRVDPA